MGEILVAGLSIEVFTQWSRWYPGVKRGVRIVNSPYDYDPLCIDKCDVPVARQIKADCNENFRLTAPEGERIEIEFVDFLLFNNDAEECAQQGLSIRDPQMESIIGKYCGNTKPPNYTTIGNALFLYLNSNTDGEYKVTRHIVRPHKMPYLFTSNVKLKLL